MNTLQGIRKPSSYGNCAPELESVGVLTIDNFIGTSVECMSKEQSELITSYASMITNTLKIGTTAFEDLVKSGAIKKAMDGVMAIYSKLPNNAALRLHLDKFFETIGKNIVSGKGGIASAAVKSIQDFSKWGVSMVDSNKKLSPEQREEMKKKLSTDTTKIFDKDGKFYEQFTETFRGKTFRDLDPQMFASGAAVVSEGALRIVRLVGTPLAGVVGGLVTAEAGGAGAVAVAGAFRTIMTGLIYIFPIIVTYLGPSIFEHLKHLIEKLIEELKNPQKLLSISSIFFDRSHVGKINAAKTLQEVRQIESTPPPTDLQSMERLVNDVDRKIEEASTAKVQSFIGTKPNIVINPSDEDVEELLDDLDKLSSLSSYPFMSAMCLLVMKPLSLEKYPVLNVIWKQFVDCIEKTSCRHSRVRYAHEALFELNGYLMSNPEDREQVALVTQQILLQSNPIWLE